MPDSPGTLEPGGPRTFDQGSTERSRLPPRDIAASSHRKPGRASRPPTDTALPCGPVPATPETGAQVPAQRLSSLPRHAPIIAESSSLRASMSVDTKRTLAGVNETPTLNGTHRSKMETTEATSKPTIFPIAPRAVGYASRKRRH